MNKCFPCDSTGIRPASEGKNYQCRVPDHQAVKLANEGACPKCHSCDGTGKYKSVVQEGFNRLLEQKN